MKLNWNFQRSGGVSSEKPSNCEGYGYFVEHIALSIS